MGRIEKTVFISYRRNNKPWALFIYQNLTMHGYDVFIDFQNINSGNFERAILDNIKARAHFVVVLTPSALQNCKNPGDWLRREIETAMDERRNIVPLMVEGFDFGSPFVKAALTGKLAALSVINGLHIPDDYPFEAMDRLRERYLNMALSDIALPVLQPESLSITEVQKLAASKAAPVEKQELTAQTWFERGYVFETVKSFNEAIRCYTEAIRLGIDGINLAITYNNRSHARRNNGDAKGALDDINEAIRLNLDRAEVYHNRGLTYYDSGNWQDALADFDKAIRLRPDNADTYNDRGATRKANKDLKGALADYNKAIRLRPDYAEALCNRGNVRSGKGDLNGAMADYNKAIRLKPDLAEAFLNRGIAHEGNGDLKDAIQDYDKALLLKPDLASAYYKRGNARVINKDLQGALEDYNQFIQLRPDDAKAYIVRAFIRENKKDYVSAIADYKKYLELGGGEDPENEKEIEEHIRSLGRKLAKKNSVKRKTK